MKKILSAALIAAAPMLVVLNGCAVTSGQESTGQYVDDATITARVKAKFATDDKVAATRISVETLNGVVQLSGFATSAEEKSRAEMLTKEIRGVKSVRNSIVVQAPGQQQRG